jgi:cytochrome c biogenesis factor
LFRTPMDGVAPPRRGVATHSSSRLALVARPGAIWGLTSGALYLF